MRITRKTDDTQASDSWPGFTIVPLTDEIRDGLSLRNESGNVIVSDVDPGTPAELAGIRAGDIIRRVGNRVVNDVAEFYELINDRSDEEITFRVVRQGREFLIGLVR